MKLLLCLLFLTSFVLADGKKDNFPENVRPVPKPGIKLSDTQKKFFTDKLSSLEGLINKIRNQNKPHLTELLPDIQIFHNAVDYALNHNEFLFDKDVNKAKFILQEGLKRAESLSKGEAPWLIQTGLVVRGFISKIDNSIQPYGLLIPESYKADDSRKFRTDIWLHGRNEKTLEVSFIHQRMTSIGKFSPIDTIVLHPYGRYSNAFKFAGEVDVFEALEHAKKWYRIDNDRIANRGFSMGGAGCWQLAVHYSDQFFASNPGAGFSETPDFLKTFQNQQLKPKWFEKVLWRWYDCPDYSVNLKQCPTIAYSGEKDRQIQAALMMEKGFEKEGMKLLHIIGPNMGHKYDEKSAYKVDTWLAEKAKTGLIHIPPEIHFVTYTLKYNKMKWLKIDAMEEHWEKSRIDAEINGHTIDFKTKNITSFSVDFPAGQSPFSSGKPVHFMIDGFKLSDLIGSKHNLSYKQSFIKQDGNWKFGLPDPRKVRKKKDLQGPIDDAFMSKFIFVTPSGKSSNQIFQSWVDSELKRAIKEWRRHFRGDAIIKSDKDVTAEDIASANLILWGDPDSNSIIKSISDKLPVKWNQDKIDLTSKSYNSGDHALIMIYPNPLNPNKYIVLNSGFTYREFAYLNNARQVPMLPDWAVIDLKVKPNTVWPGKVVDANFFDESWQLKIK